MILVEQLQPGDRLPPERELAETLGVNRMTLRSALSELQANRLIVARQGSGNIVTAYQEVGGPSLLPDLIGLASDVDQIELCADLLLIRRQLAVAALTKLLSLKERDVSGIEVAVERFGNLAQGDASTAELAAADVAVVAAMLEATGSPAFRLIINPVARSLEALPALRDVLYANPHHNAIAYETLIAWLRRPSKRGIDQLLQMLTMRDNQTINELRARLREGGNA